MIEAWSVRQYSGLSPTSYLISLSAYNASHVVELYFYNAYVFLSKPQIFVSA